MQFPHPGWCKLKFPTFHLSLQKAMFLESTTTLVRSHWSFHPQHTTLRKHYQPQPVQNQLFHSRDVDTWAISLSLCECWADFCPAPMKPPGLPFLHVLEPMLSLWSSQHPTIKLWGQHLTQRPTPTSEPTKSQGQHGCPQAAVNTLGQVTTIPFTHSPRGAGVSLGSIPASVSLMPKLWKGTPQNKTYCPQSNSSAGFSCA